MFTDGFTLRPWHVVPRLILEAAAFTAVGADVAPSVATAASHLHHATILILYAGAIAGAVSGYAADLIDSRRRFRLIFTAGTAVLGVAIAIGEMVLRGSTVPGWLELLKVSAIAVLVLLLLVWSFEMRPLWFAAAGAARAAPELAQRTSRFSTRSGKRWRRRSVTARKA